MAPKTLLPYIVLSQILPISFTAALFVIHLHLHLADNTPAAQAPPPAKKPTSKPLASPLLPSLLLNLSLLALPTLRQSRSSLFIPTVLFTRILLVLPYTGLLRLSDREVGRCITLSAGFMVAGLWRVRGKVSLGGLVGVLGRGYGEVYGGWAVKTLAWDAVLGGVVAGVLSWGGGV